MSGSVGVPDLDFLGVDPLLLPLDNYGGRSDTYALDAASPAIDVPDNCGSSFLGQIFFEDQRRVDRPDDLCDTGAYEFHPLADRYDYAFWLSDGSSGEGRFTLLEDGRFLDKLSRFGDWERNTPRLSLQYKDASACDAFVVERSDDGGVTYQGSWLCTDGSGVRGRFTATLVE